MLLLICLLHLTTVDGSYFVRHNMLYGNRDEYDLRRPPVGCVCRPTGLLRKTGFHKRCSKAYNHLGRKIKYLNVDDGACLTGKKQFFGCNALTGLQSLGCCLQQDDHYIPANGAQYYASTDELGTLRPVIATCAPDRIKLNMTPYRGVDGKVIISKLHLLSPVSYAIYKEPPSLAEQQTPQQRWDNSI